MDVYVNKVSEVVDEEVPEKDLESLLLHLVFQEPPQILPCFLSSLLIPMKGQDLKPT